MYEIFTVGTLCTVIREQFPPFRCMGLTFFSPHFSKTKTGNRTFRGEINFAHNRNRGCFFFIHTTRTRLASVLMVKLFLDLIL